MFYDDYDEDVVDENNVLFDKDMMRNFRGSNSNLKRVKSYPALSSHLQKYKSLLSRDINPRGCDIGSTNDIRQQTQTTFSRLRKVTSILKPSSEMSERRKRLKGMSRPVSIRDFKAWVKRSSSDSEFRFAEEFESMRDMGKNERHDAADRAENRDKNRYNNILPYDYTRVRLSLIDRNPCSDYINANYIHGYKQPRAYIAAQGPLEETTNDFWRMTWEQKTAIIIMITRCTERGRRKCHQYWPSEDSMRFGKITVTPLDELVSPHWTERKFILECDGESRFLRHMQYTTWPDHGVPNSPTDLLKFIQKVRLHQPLDGPLICHCSAGIGRSGTYICIDILLNKLQYENNVDVYGVVCLMRTQRCNMVQTEEQYIFIHHVILEYFNKKDMCKLEEISPLSSSSPAAYCKENTLHPSDISVDG